MPSLLLWMASRKKRRNCPTYSPAPIAVAVELASLLSSPRNESVKVPVQKRYLEKEKKGLSGPLLSTDKRKRTDSKILGRGFCR